MDARIKFLLVVVAVASLGADYSTKNFTVSAPDPQLAKQVAIAAEQFRKELAIQWLGRELPTWNEKCPITVRIDAQAGGQTSFGFVSDGGRSVPVGWKMEIFGSPERILDSVLPHEVTHTIFATHFGRPLPRWADEGACTTVEHASERNKNHELLLRFLTSNRGIPFNRMFAMKDYPHDIYPLYAQGYSLARFLIMQGGHQHFVKYIGAGMATEKRGMEPRAWNAATKKFYGYADLSELQVRWVQWVREGCKDLSKAPSAALADGSAPKPNADLAARPKVIPSQPKAELVSQLDNAADRSNAPTAEPRSWYISQAKSQAGEEVSAAPTPVERRATPAIGDSYRPGSIRQGQPIEYLATVSPSNVSANRINPESNYFARPEIQPRSSPLTIWR